MKILIISGKAGNGKDTLGQIFKNKIEERGERVLTIHFGDPVKWFAKAYFGYQGIKDVKDRKILQTLGTDMMRTNYPTYWGEMIAKFISVCKNLYDYCIIPDWRFQNELEMVELYNKNIITIRVERPGYVNPNMTPEQLNHISECELDNFNFDWIVENTTIEKLEQSVEYILDFSTNL